MEQSKKEFLPVLQGVKLSKTQSPTTAEDRKRMKVIPYALAIGSIKYAMLCTRSIVYPILILLENVAEIQNFLRITKINLWSNLATRGGECIYIPL